MQLSSLCSIIRKWFDNPTTSICPMREVCRHTCYYETVVLNTDDNALINTIRASFFGRGVIKTDSVYLAITIV